MTIYNVITSDDVVPVIAFAGDNVIIDLPPQGTIGPQGVQGPKGPTSTVPGPRGDVGPEGDTGIGVLYGATDPVTGIGIAGDFYINTATNFIFGPKATTWPAGTSLVGPQGPKGPQGIQGVQGIPGFTVLYGSTNPVAGTGVNGDSYINTATNFMFGPKAAGAWPAGTPLVGPQGPQGDQGIQGSSGPGDGDVSGPAGAGATVPVQTGTNLDFPVNSSAQTGTVSSTITVPADAQMVIVGVSNYHNVTDGHITMTFTKGGVDTAMSREGGGDNSRNWETTLFWLVSPDTGANKTLKWSWTSSTSDANQVFSVTFWKGIDTASPVRSSAGNNGIRWPRNTPLLTAQDGDRIVAFSGFYYGSGGGVGEVSTWNNLTEIAECANQGYAEGAWASTTDIITPAVYSPLVPFAMGSDVPFMSHRLRCPTTSGGSQVRVTFSAVDTGWNTRHCSVGIATTNTSTAATPVELKFGGASGFSIAGGTTITSDWADLPFTAGQALVVVMDHGASPARFSYWTGNISSFPSPVGTAHSWLAATQSWNNSSDAGFNQVNEDAVGVLSVESNGSTGNLSVGVAYSTGSEGGIAALVLKGAAGASVVANNIATYSVTTGKIIKDGGKNIAAAVLKAGDTLTGPLILNADPSAALGISTKQYIDGKVAGFDASTKLSKAGDSMTGPLILNANPSAALGAATKQYTDAKVSSVDLSSKLSKSGDTMTGGLTVNGELIAGTNYLRFTTPDSGGFIQWNGGANYTVGGYGIWHTGNVNPANYVSNGRLAFAADYNFTAFGGMQEPYGGAVITGMDWAGPARWRYMQLYTTGWWTVGYA